MNSILLNGKNCFISGASGGLGEEIAKELANQKCNLFLTGRDGKKLSKIKEDIKKISNDKIKVEYEIGELNNLDDIKKNHHFC